MKIWLAIIIVFAGILIGCGENKNQASMDSSVETGPGDRELIVIIHGSDDFFKKTDACVEMVEMNPVKPGSNSYIVRCLKW